MCIIDTDLDHCGIGLIADRVRDKYIYKLIYIVSAGRAYVCVCVGSDQKN